MAAEVETGRTIRSSANGPKPAGVWFPYWRDLVTARTRHAVVGCEAHGARVTSVAPATNRIRPVAVVRGGRCAVPSSVVFAALVLAWLVVLVPVVARRRQMVPRPAEADLSARVLPRTAGAPLIEEVPVTTAQADGRTGRTVAAGGRAGTGATGGTATGTVLAERADETPEALDAELDLDAQHDEDLDDELEDERGRARRRRRPRRRPPPRRARAGPAPGPAPGRRRVPRGRVPRRRVPRRRLEDDEARRRARPAHLPARTGRLRPRRRGRRGRRPLHVPPARRARPDRGGGALGAGRAGGLERHVVAARGRRRRPGRLPRLPAPPDAHRGGGACPPGRPPVRGAARAGGPPRPPGRARGADGRAAATQDWIDAEYDADDLDDERGPARGRGAPRRARAPLGGPAHAGAAGARRTSSWSTTPTTTRRSTTSTASASYGYRRAAGA